MRNVWLPCLLVLSACYGPPGAPGPEGRQGPRGEEGPAGSGYRPAFRVACSRSLDLISVPASGISRTPDGLEETLLRYSVLAYTNGDAQVQCGVSIGAAQEGSDTNYYPSVTKGAEEGSCIASADFPSANSLSAGYWQFDVVTACPRAVYHDADNPLGLNGFSYQYAESECKTLIFGMDGNWSMATLADVF